jgi:hypothetical protein
MNRLTLSTLLLAIAVPALAQMPAGMQHRHGMDAAADGRQAIAVNSMQRERMLAEMRAFLESVQGVLDGAARNDAAAVAAGEYKFADAEMGAQATMSAILGRMATYSGQVVEWDEALNSNLSLMPEHFSWDANPPVMPDANGRYPVPVPGESRVV